LWIQTPFDGQGVSQHGRERDVTTVVTGGAGHIGGALVRALLASGRSVRAVVHRDRRALEGLDVETVRGDVLDPASLRQAFDGADAVYHAAGHVSILMNEGPLLEAVNVRGTRNVVEACLDCGVCRLVHFSSIHALDLGRRDAPVDESWASVRASSYLPYDRSKAEGEQEVRAGIQRGLDAVILNPTAVIGPLDYRPSHMGQVLLALAHGKLPALVEGGFDWVDVRDVAEGAVLAELHGEAGARYILSGHWISVRDVAQAVTSVTGVRTPRLVCPMPVARIGAPIATALARLAGKRPLYTRAALCLERELSDQSRACNAGPRLPSAAI
jgi:dihydroflavonol-4-reductase